MSSEEPTFCPTSELRERVYRRAALLRRRRQFARGLVSVSALVIALATVMMVSRPAEQSVRVVAPGTDRSSGNPTTTGTVAPSASTSNMLTIRRVDTTKLGQMRVLVQLATGDGLDGSRVRANGREVADVDVAPPSNGRRIVFVVDTSGSMSEGELDQVKAAIRSFLPERNDDDLLAVVGFNNTATIAQRFSYEVTMATLDRLVAENETALWDGLRTGLDLWSTETARATPPNVVLITDGRDTVSSTSLASVRASAVALGASVFTIGIEGPELDPAPLVQLASSTGGLYQSGPVELVPSMVTRVQTVLEQQYELVFSPGTTDAPVDIEVSANGFLVEASNIGWGTVTPKPFLDRELEKSGSRPLGRSVPAWAVAALVLVAVGLWIYAVVDLMGRRRRHEYLSGSERMQGGGVVAGE